MRRARDNSKMCNFVEEEKSVFVPEWRGRSMGCTSHPLHSSLQSLQSAGWQQRGSCQVYGGGLGLGVLPFLFFFFVYFVLTEDLIPPGTCLTRITRISGMNDLSRWLFEGSVPIPGQAEILALSAVALAAFNVCSSPYKYCLGSKFGQLWDYCTICNPYALLNLWLARWLRGSFSTPAVSPPCPCALGGTIQHHWLDSSWQGEQ